MREHVIGLFCLFAPLAPAVAQMTVDVSLGQEQYLSGEAVTAVVRVTNLSGRSVRLGADNEWLTFSIDGRENLVVRQLGDVPVTGEFVLENSQRATKRVDIAPYFSIGEPGHYRITATVRVKEWGFEASSAPAGFNVIEGAKLWEREFGVPSSGGTNGAPEIRKYILQQANYLRNGLALFLRVTDASGEKSYRVAPIGGLLSFSRKHRWIASAGYTSSIKTPRTRSVTSSSTPTANCSCGRPMITPILAPAFKALRTETFRWWAACGAWPPRICPL